jgi:hypothetical protein
MRSREVQLRPRRDIDPGSQLFLVSDLRSGDTHPGALVEAERAGQALAVDEELDRGTTAPMELTECILEQRETETAVASSGANDKARHHAAGAIERQVWAPEHEAGHAVAVPRPPTTTHPG